MNEYELLQKELNNYEQKTINETNEIRKIIKAIENNKNLFEIDMTNAFNIFRIDKYLKEYIIFLLDNQKNFPFIFKSASEIGILSVFYEEIYIGYISFVKKQYSFKKKPKFFNNNINEYRKHIKQTERFLEKEKNKKFLKKKRTIKKAEQHIRILEKALTNETKYQKNLYKEKIKEYNKYKIAIDSFGKILSSSGYKKIRN